MATLEDNTVYMTLNTRGIPGAFVRPSLFTYLPKYSTNNLILSTLEYS